MSKVDSCGGLHYAPCTLLAITFCPSIEIEIFFLGCKLDNEGFDLIYNFTYFGCKMNHKILVVMWYAMQGEWIIEYVPIKSTQL